jgi:hypothetical protein
LRSPDEPPQTCNVLDDADRSTVADHLDPSGTHRRALRAALLNVLADRPLVDHSCDLEQVRVPHCLLHYAARTAD